MRTDRWRLSLVCLVAIAVYSAVGLAAPGPHSKATTHHFQVQWGGTSTGFMHVSGLDSKVDVLEYREGNSASETRIKAPGKPTFTNLVLRNPASDMAEMWEWYKLTLRNSPERRDIIVSILNANHEPVITYKFRNAWPCAWRGPVLEAGDKAVAVEEVEIAYEEMIREQE